MKKDQPSPHRGEAHYLAKLTDAAVIFIRRSGESCTSLAKRFGVCKATISAAKTGRKWKHVEAAATGYQSGAPAEADAIKRSRVSHYRATAATAC